MTATEDLARLRKAVPIADVISICELRYQDLTDGAATEKFWKIASQGAGYDDYVPSAKTRQVILAILKKREELAAKLCPQKS